MKAVICTIKCSNRKWTSSSFNKPDAPDAEQTRAQHFSLVFPNNVKQLALETTQHRIPITVEKPSDSKLEVFGSKLEIPGSKPYIFGSKLDLSGSKLEISGSKLEARKKETLPKLWVV